MTKSPRELSMRTILLPRDTNAGGSIFGGVILSHIDLAAAVPAKKLAPTKRFVTVAMEKVEFLEPVFVGDLVSFYTQVVEIGRSSLKVHVDVIVERRDSPGTEIEVTSAFVTYVAVGADRRPIPIL